MTSEEGAAALHENSNSKNDSLTKFKLKRGQFKAQLTRFTTYVDNFDVSSGNYDELGVRCDKITFCLEAFNDVQTDIECLMGGKFDQNERADFEDKYFNVTGKAKKLLTNYFKAQSAPPIQSPVAPSGASTPSNSNPIGGANIDLQGPVRLPPINLPEFQGTYSQWMTFYDIFNSLIHSNSQLNDVQKFWYLKSCLKGEPSQLIQSLEISNSNYTVAWGMLKDRYQNKKMIVHSHVKNIFDASSMKNESHYQLRSLLDNFSKNLRALEALGQPVDNWDILLLHIISAKLDPATKREWEEFLNKENIDFPTIKQFTEFLTKRCNFLETLENKSKGEKSSHPKTLTYLNTGKVTCAFCHKNHLNFQCEKIKSIPVADLYTEIKKHKLCHNCLRPFHDKFACNSAGCKYCGRKHHSLLHVFYNQNNTQNNQPHTRNENPRENRSETVTQLQITQPYTNTKSIQLKTDTSSPLTTQGTEINNTTHSTQNTQGADYLPFLNMHCLNPQNRQILLATAIIKIQDYQGNLVEARAILDSASQSNFISNSLAKRLKLNKQKFTIPVAGINNSINNISNKLEAAFMSTNGNYKTKDSFLIVDKITENLPQVTFDLSQINIPHNIQLADKRFNVSRPVDILLGVNIFFDILCVGQIKLGNNKPVLHKTKLGWILIGSLLSNDLQQEEKNKTICNLLITNNDLHKQMEKFWLLENATGHKNELPQDIACEKHFVENYTRISSGRFEVGLPLISESAELGDSKNLAMRRFYSLERRLHRDENLKRDYCKFMHEYINLGHMTVINDPDIETEKTYYLPHHGVFKADSTTTKLRVVFDASAKSDTGISLNNILMTGPIVQPDLLTIILNFRCHNVVFTGDIEKMYRQVQLRKSDRNLQRILWRSNTNDEVKHYTLNTVTYGTASASFLATRSLNQAAIDNSEKYPNACKAILSSFYVDDLLTGSDTIENAIMLKNQIIKILKDACFPLRKFYSNKAEVLVDCDQGQLENLDLSEDKTRKTLGLFWHPSNDTFSYSVNVDSKEIITKRQILSTIAKIFDPLGLVGPITVRAKIIMQRLWQSNVGWDESVPIDIFTLWKTFSDQLPHLNSIKIPRQVTIPNYILIELHGFCDSSEVAYGACIYLVSTDSSGRRQSKLLCAKSRIAPLKTISLPRLELCGALLLACLTKNVESEFNVKITKRHFWCDSTIVLSWIAGEPNYWNTFVANRITQIHDLTEKSEWRHVSSTDNAADILSRGHSPQQLNESTLWWNGPKFLEMHESYWPVSKHIDMENIPDRKKSVQLSFTYVFNDQSIFQSFSSFHKLLHVFGYVMRFIFNSKSINKNKRVFGSLTNSELENSLNTLLKMVQWAEFSKEISDLRLKKQISRDSKLISLNPFLDEKGLLRVGGRIRHSLLTPDVKYPILLPPNHNFTNLLIAREHERNLHLATQGLLSVLRNKYWIIHGKGAVKRIINKCINCCRLKPIFNTPMMGDLPQSRLIPQRPFLTVGCDFAGPIMIKDGTLRTRKMVKAYICIFICFVTRAIHIELVGDLSTNSFFNALKRFVARRGLCKDIYTDNAKNFVGANQELKKIFHSIQEALKNPEVSSFLSHNDINWHFIPPRSPSFGGLWEAAVKSTKFHLTRILKEAFLTFESLSTVLCQIEAILNSRPLTPLSSDPNDLSALTPSHFLIGDMLSAVPQRDVLEIPKGRLDHYQRLQQLTQHFWRRWSQEYLTSLQARTKWRSGTGPSIVIGSLVLLREENVPPQQWILGRVIDVHPGKDKIVRVASVKTKTGVFKRAVTKLSVLPLQVD